MGLFLAENKLKIMATIIWAISTLAVTILAIYLISKIKDKVPEKYYCDLYKESKMLDSGLCSAGPDCDICPHKKRLV